MTTEMPAPTSSDQPRPERVLRASRPRVLDPLGELHQADEHRRGVGHPGHHPGGVPVRRGLQRHDVGDEDRHERPRGPLDHRQDLVGHADDEEPLPVSGVQARPVGVVQQRPQLHHADRAGRDRAEGPAGEERPAVAGDRREHQRRRGGHRHDARRGVADRGVATPAERDVDLVQADHHRAGDDGEHEQRGEADRARRRGEVAPGDGSDDERAGRHGGTRRSGPP